MTSPPPLENRAPYGLPNIDAALRSAQASLEAALPPAAQETLGTEQVQLVDSFRHQAAQRVARARDALLRAPYVLRQPNMDEAASGPPAASLWSADAQRQVQHFVDVGEAAHKSLTLQLQQHRRRSSLPAGACRIDMRQGCSMSEAVRAVVRSARARGTPCYAEFASYPVVAGPQTSICQAQQDLDRQMDPPPASLEGRLKRAAFEIGLAVGWAAIVPLAIDALLPFVQPVRHDEADLWNWAHGRTIQPNAYAVKHLHHIIDSKKYLTDLCADVSVAPATAFSCWTAAAWASNQQAQLLYFAGRRDQTHHLSLWRQAIAKHRTTCQICADQSRA